jgi:hypothetical protein
MDRHTHMIISFLVPTSTFIKIANKYTRSSEYSNDKVYSKIYDLLCPEYKARFDVFATACYNQMQITRDGMTDKEAYVIQALLLQYFLCP